MILSLISPCFTLNSSRFLLCYGIEEDKPAGEDSEIRIISPDGSEEYKLADIDRCELVDPTFSPDGSKVAYVDFGGSSHIYVIDGFKGLEEEEVLPEPPRFTNSNLITSPTQVYPDNTVSISVNVSNIGGTAGSRVVDLVINGTQEQSRTITVEPNSSQRVEFTVTRSTAGTYSFYCGGIPGQFHVMSTETVIHQGPTVAQTYIYDDTGGLGTGGIIAVVVIGIMVIAGIIVAIVMTRR
ncbi:CARDB domain-containing protein [Chloroflexota bacterium]